MSPRLRAALLSYLERPTITLPEIPPMKIPIHLDIAQVFGLAPDAAHIVGLLIRFKSKKSDGGKAITEVERAELQEALEDLVGELMTAPQGD